MGCYSDNGVDATVEPLLPAFGYACEVGANSGTNRSNTMAFEEKGWMVLCVEANPLLEASGRASRKLWRQVACSDADAEDVEFCSVGGFPHESCSSLDGTRYGSSDITSRHRVSTRRLDRILEEAGFPRLDYLAIDVEGWEQEVLAGFTIERWKPTIIVLEDYLARYPGITGYSELSKMTFDRVFKRNDPPQEAEPGN